MPIYEYECEKCGRFEKLTSSVSTDPEYRSKCPVCGQASPRKDWSVPAKRNPDYGIVR